MPDVLASLWFFLPAAIANMMPVVLARIFGKASYPVDFGITLRGRRLFGENKTWRGFLSGILCAMLFFAIQKALYEAGVLRALAALPYDEYSLLIGFLLGAGALAADLAKSFFKRQLGIGPGKPLYVVDQLDYVLGGFLATFWLVPLGFSSWAVIFAGYFVLVIATNHLSYALGIRGERW